MTAGREKGGRRMLAGGVSVHSVSVMAGVSGVSVSPVSMTAGGVSSGYPAGFEAGQLTAELRR